MNKIDVTANLFFTDSLERNSEAFAVVTCLQGRFEYRTGQTDLTVAKFYAVAYALKQIIASNFDATVYVCADVKRYINGYTFDAHTDAYERYIVQIWRGVYSHCYKFPIYHLYGETEYQYISRVKISLNETEEMKKIWTRDFKGVKLND